MNASIKAAFKRFWYHVIARTGEMITQANEYTDTQLQQFVNTIYPIGSIYMSTSSTSPPL